MGSTLITSGISPGFLTCEWAELDQIASKEESLSHPHGCPQSVSERIHSNDLQEAGGRLTCVGIYQNCASWAMIYQYHPTINLLCQTPNPSFPDHLDLEGRIISPTPFLCHSHLHIFRIVVRLFLFYNCSIKMLNPLFCWEQNSSFGLSHGNTLVE